MAAVAFDFCYSLRGITIPESVTSIGGWVFEGCYFERDKFINKSAFSRSDNRWGSFMIYSKIQADGLCITGPHYAVDCIETATDVTIPESITEIFWVNNEPDIYKNRVFDNCDALESIYCKPTTPPGVGSEGLGIGSSVKKIYVPIGCAEAYKTTGYWKDYASKIEEYDFENNPIE